MGIRGGIDLGGTKIQAVVVDDGGDVLGSSRMPTPTTGGPPDVAETMAEAIRDAAKQADADTGDLEGVGVGSPGAVADDEGTVAAARNLPDWEEAYPLRDDLSSRLDTRVRLGNDVQVATDAEFELGAAQQYSSILGVFWGTGVGGGIVLDGKPWLGRSAAGEIGHVVVSMGGRKCPCGRRGCMEAYAGRLALERRARELEEKGQHTNLFEIMEERGRDRLTSGVWARALKAEDEVARKLIHQAVKALGAGVASCVNVLDVEAVVIGGGMGIRLGEPYVKRIREAMMPHLFVDSRPPAVVGATLGDLGGAIGASLLVVRPG
ncbi:MAG TPA: ROK family protein [Thermoleophilaceae bacterium]|jgi:glucokinase|nr:ROK family protein [Thermoleophilaceae bacterium]